MTEKERLEAIAILIKEQTADDRSRHVEPEYAMRFMAGSNPRIQTLDPHKLGAMVDQGAAKKLPIIEEPRPPDHNTGELADKRRYDEQCRRKWQNAMIRAKRAECQYRQATESILRR